ALPDRQIQRLGVTPIAGPVFLVVILGRVWPVRLILFRQIDSRPVPHRERDATGNQSAQPDLQSELVEVGVAGMLYRILEAQRPMSFLLPAAEITVSVL